MPVDGPSYLVGRTEERVLTMFFQVLTIDACGQALSETATVDMVTQKKYQDTHLISQESATRD